MLTMDKGEYMTTNKRNGTVEFLRMVFCFVVLIYHFSCDIYGTDWRPISWGGVLRYGALAVEFFLITSGYFMAKSVSRQGTSCKDIGKDTWCFMWRKVKAILPYHVCFNLFMILVNILRRKPIDEILHKVSSLFFLPTLGFNNFEWTMGSEWYIGNMLFAMLTIYPFLRKFNKIVSLYAAPVASLVLYGYLAQRYGTVMGSNRILEAFAGILLGISVYTVSEEFKERLKERYISKTGELLIKIYPVLVIIFILLYMNTSISTSIQPFLVLILGSGLAITFAERGLLSSTGILNNSFAYWLGKMSPPIYMVQNITRMIVKNYLGIESIQLTYIVEAISTILAGILSYYALNILLKRIACYKNNRKAT